MLLNIYNLQGMGKSIGGVFQLYYQQHWEGEEGGFFGNNWF